MPPAVRTPLRVRTALVERILTRTSGYLKDVTSHSLQPYRGCSFGNALCGVGCYVQHNRWLLKGEAWGSFLEARVPAADCSRREAAAERRWARGARGRFSIFLSSSTDPFVPQEARLGVTRAVLEAMRDEPPDELVLQTHGDGVLRVLDLCRELARRLDLRAHVSIESDRERLPGLPPPACSVERRFRAARALRAAGVRTVVTVAPLLPIEDPRAFFERCAGAADAVVLDHFVGGDGSRAGARTLKTALPAAIAAVDPQALDVAYRDAMAEVARAVMPGRVGISRDGFAGRFA